MSQQFEKATLSGKGLQIGDLLIPGLAFGQNIQVRKVGGSNSPMSIISLEFFCSELVIEDMEMSVGPYKGETK